MSPAAKIDGTRVLLAIDYDRAERVEPHADSGPERGAITVGSPQNRCHRVDAGRRAGDIFSVRRTSSPRASAASVNLLEGNAAAAQQRLGAGAQGAALGRLAPAESLLLPVGRFGRPLGRPCQ